MAQNKDLACIMSGELRELIRATITATLNDTDANKVQMGECEVAFIDALHDYINYRIEQYRAK